MKRCQGIGTIFYGKRNYDPLNKSFIATKWFVIFLLPIIPLKSYRMIEIHKSEKFYGVAWSGAESYNIIEEISLKKNIKQILFTYIFVYGGLGLFILFWYLSLTIVLFIFPAIAIPISALIWYLITSK